MFTTRYHCGFRKNIPYIELCLSKLTRWSWWTQAEGSWVTAIVQWEATGYCLRAKMLIFLQIHPLKLVPMRCYQELVFLKIFLMFICVWVYMWCRTGMVTQVDPWNPRKVGRRETAPWSCPLTHTCMLLHTHPISSYRYIRTNDKIKNKIMIQWFSVCHKAIPLCTIKHQDISLAPGKTLCHEQSFFIIPLPQLLKPWISFQSL